ncbi:hypothetical protein [Shewanella colwelliana]|uniref:Outer membrane protein beta-barrel domain-containing protein n=2 Tax=Shewanella colwelliana TaxID=23 RepID=A0A1E5IXN8_SHECO|nr:hypothetical protein [Shewanella colwelliana]MDX1281885.1 hypothetical protein [Shewanella colwelliana]OEG75352.1 hypothetical protein BEL05_09110 [Shewanella colwelliana]
MNKPSLKNYLLISSVIFSPLTLATPENQDDWEFSINPYMWLTDHRGSAGFAELPPVEMSPKNIIDDAQYGLSLSGSAVKGNHGIYVDYSYSDIRSSEEIGPVLGDLDVYTTTTLFTMAYGYEVFQNENTHIQLLAGTRYTNVNYDYHGGIPLLTGNASDSWFDALIGVQGQHQFKDSNLFVNASGQIGGISSDGFYDVQANLGYQFTPAISGTVGYRQFDVDYSNGDFVYDIKQQGWQLGLNWDF